MLVTQTQSRDELAEFFRQDPALYAYSLGDLDPLFFPHTRWWIALEGSEIRATLLLYTAFEVPIIHGLADNDAQGVLWSELLHELPEHAYVHFRSRHCQILERRYRIDNRDTHYKMRWQTENIEPTVPTGGLRRLTPHDVPAIRSLYARAMPKAHLDLRMVELGKTFGWVEEDSLVSIATCHIFSQEYAVAAIGAVATCPTCRGRGLGTAVTWALTRDVARDVPIVALNVHSDNQTAIGIYERLGYRRCHRYEEALVTAIS